jgi:hypothetical protein
MPTLDVTDVLFDPDFCDFNLWVTRRAQTVDEDGIGSDSEVKTQFAGVVTVDRSGKPPHAVRAGYQWRDSHRDN